MAKYEDRLKDYVDVKERVRLLYEQHPDARLVTAEVIPSTEPDGVARIWVKAAAYRTPDDPLPGIGWSWIVLPGSTPYTKGSEIENAETSAWGRAIGSLGIGIAQSIASGDEVRAKQVPADVERGDDGSVIGNVEVGKAVTSDYSIRNTPQGPALGFRLRGDKGGILVEAKGDLATQLDEHRDRVIGTRVTVYGNVSTRTVEPKGKPKYEYLVLDASRISVPILGLLPQWPDHADMSVDEGPDTVTAPMFNEDEEAEIAAALGVTS